jgi:integrase
MQDAVRLEDGNVVVYVRGGSYYVRLKAGTNKYFHRSLKTGNLDEAKRLALRYWHQFEVKQDLGIPFQVKTFNAVIDEYVKMRTLQHTQGKTSSYMLRQIERVVKFWRKYAGSKAIANIGNAELNGYVTWRRDYYSDLSDEELPKNAKRNPTDKTLQWEIMLGKAMIKWAHEKGYRGTQALPTFTFVPKKKRVRPAFELNDYRKLWRAMIKWEKNCEDERFLHTRQLLRAYVLILANSGMRVGEANSLRFRDVQTFRDGAGRRNYRFVVRGKTGERDVIPRADAARYVDRVLERNKEAKPDDYFFAMKGGTKIITLADQFDKVLELGEIERNSHGEKFSLYSLRHFYAVQALRKGIGVFDIARNMGTSVQIIQSYYGKTATPMSMATTLGGRVRVPKKQPRKSAKPKTKRVSKEKAKESS